MKRTRTLRTFSLFQKIVAYVLSAAIPLATLPSAALALPHGGVVSKGSATMGYSPGRLGIKQTTSSATFNWGSYNVKAGQSVVYQTPGARAVSMNYIGGTTPSSINGSVTSNGILFFMNPNGLIFGSGSVVSAAGVMAFGSAAPWGKPTGPVTNAGVLTATNDGTVALVGTNVANSGTISAPGGTVILAAGSTVTPLALTGSSSLSVATTGGGLVDDSGIVSAETLNGQTGHILLQSGMSSGTTTLESTAVLDASAPKGGNGGAIETSGSRVNVADGAVVTTEATNGETGTWLMDPASFYIGMNTGSANSTSGNVLSYQDISGSQLATDLGSSNVVIDSTNGAQGTLGNIYVNNAVTWNSANSLTLNAVHNVNVNQVITNNGTGNIVLRADDMDLGGVATNTTGGGVPSGVGTVNINTGGSVGTAGNLSVYTNPSTYGISLTNPGTAGGNYVNGGTGTVTAYGLLSSNADLYWIDQNQNATTLANNYVLNTNITLPSFGASGIDGTQISAASTANGFSTPSSSTYSNWIRFGGGSIHYSGSFDGLGYTVTDMTIDDTIHSNVGFFGVFASGSILQNVGMVGGSVSGTSSANTNHGGLVGTNLGTITNSYTTGNVSTGGTASLQYTTGGISGVNSGTITNSYTTGNVSGSSSGGHHFEGGISGKNIYGSISDSYSTGSVSGTGTGYHYTGGLVGNNYHGSISGAYSTGSVSGNQYVGGLVGGATSSTTTFSYWDTTSSGQSSSHGGTGLSSLNNLENNLIGPGNNWGWNSWGTNSFSNSNHWFNLTNGAPILVGDLGTTTIIANGQHIVYNGSSYSGGNGYMTVLPTMGASSSNLSGSVSYAGTSQNATNVGVYTITPGGLTLSAPIMQNEVGFLNYDSGILTITPATLTATANSAIGFYGSAIPALSGSVTGFMNGQTLSGDGGSWTTSATTASNVGSYGVSLALGSPYAGDYTIVNAVGNTTALTVTALPTVLQTVYNFQDLPALPETASIATATSGPSPSTTAGLTTLAETGNSSLTILQLVGTETTDGGILSVEEMKQ